MQPRMLMGRPNKEGDAIDIGTTLYDVKPLSMGLHRYAAKMWVLA
jgi:hypothetical protein